MDEQAGPPAEAVQLSDHDREMLERQVEDLAVRERESRESMTKPAEEKKWVVEQPRVHHPESKGGPRDIKRGDKVDLTSRGTRHMSHPIGNEKLPLPA